MKALRHRRRRLFYYKVQVYDELSLSWVDEHLSFSSEDSARNYIAHRIAPRKARVMSVQGPSRYPLQ